MYKIKPEYADYVRFKPGVYRKKLSELTQKEIQQWNEESPTEVAQYFIFEETAANANAKKGE